MSKYYFVLEESTGEGNPKRELFEISPMEFTDMKKFMNNFSGKPTQRRNHIHDLAQN
jgi:hypothetical protein